MMRSIALLGAVTPFVMALVPSFPTPTNPLVGGVDLRGFSPKPTEAAVHPDLRKRQGGQSLLGYLAPDNTCGYVSGISSLIKTCDSLERCGAVIVDGVATMGCCDTIEDTCTWLGNCIGYEGYYSSSLCDAACELDINTIKCTNAARPYCYSYLVPSSSIGFFSCASTFSDAFDVFETTYSGEASRSWAKIYNTDSAAASSIILQTSALGTSAGFVLTNTDSTAAETSLAAGSSGAGGYSGSSGSSGDFSKSKSKKKKAPIGGIAGGIIGGLAIIAAIVVGIVLLILKKKKQNQSNAIQVAGGIVPGPGQPGPDMTQQQQQQPGMYPNQGQYPPQGQAPQGQYNVGGYDNQNLNGNAAGAAGYFAAFPGKTDEPYQQQQQQAAYPSKDGLTVTEQSIPTPQSPPPQYVQPHMQPQAHQDMVSPMSPPTPAVSPPPQMMQGQYAQPQPFQQPQQSMQQQPVELGTQHSVPTHTRDGKPVFEAA